MTDPNMQQNQELTPHEQEHAIEAANQNLAVSRILIIILFLFSALELLLAIRVILYLIGANIDNGFAGSINRLSGPSVEFFANLVHNPTVGTTGVLEVTTLIAMIVYAILALSVVSRPSREPKGWDSRRSVD
jgi:phage shock protein PspC (stress-responsive transcriptional regulator)